MYCVNLKMGLHRCLNSNHYQGELYHVNAFHVFFLFAEILIEFPCCKIFVKYFSTFVCWISLILHQKHQQGGWNHVSPFQIQHIYFLFAGTGASVSLDTCPTYLVIAIGGKLWIQLKYSFRWSVAAICLVQGMGWLKFLSVKNLYNVLKLIIHIFCVNVIYTTALFVQCMNFSGATVK